MSTILKLFVLPVSLLIICAGIVIILGGHITPGGGFQGGAVIASALIFCIIVYGLKDNPFELSHNFMSAIESIGALLYIILGLIGLAIAGSFLYNIGVDLGGVVPANIQNIFNYPDVTSAGIIPYLNIAVGLKVAVGLSVIVLTFMQFKPNKKIEDD